MESSPITTDDESYFGASWLRSTQAPLISCSTRSAKLLFFQKAAAVDCRICVLSRLQGTKGGGLFSGAYGTPLMQGELRLLRDAALDYSAMAIFDVETAQLRTKVDPSWSTLKCDQP